MLRKKHNKTKKIGRANKMVRWSCKWIQKNPIIIVGIVAIFGVIFTIMASASSPFVAFEPEASALSSGAAAQVTSGASGGSAIKFPAASASTIDLSDPAKKEIAMKLVSSAENSSLDWKAQYAYIEDIGDGRGYTAGIIGFCTGCGDLLKVVQYYNTIAPGNILAKYIPALQAIGSWNPTHAGLDPTFVPDWKTAALDPLFQQAQDHERDRVYFNPAVAYGKTDGIGVLGQFMYYDAMVMHGPNPGETVNCSQVSATSIPSGLSFEGIRAAAKCRATAPARGGNETTYLSAFLDMRKLSMLTESAHSDTTRVDTEQRVFLNAGNLNLNLPLSWKVYGDSYTITN